MVAAFASTCILFTVSILGALNIQLEPYGILHWKEDLLLDMAQSGASVPGGLPLGEFSKDTPPGWIPGDPSCSLKLYMERVRMWYRTFEGPDEMVGPLIAGRLQGRAQTIAHSLRLVDPLARRRPSSTFCGRSVRSNEPGHYPATGDPERCPSPHEHPQGGLRRC